MLCVGGRGVYAHISVQVCVKVLLVNISANLQSVFVLFFQRARREKAVNRQSFIILLYQGVLQAVLPL